MHSSKLSYPKTTVAARSPFLISNVFFFSSCFNIWEVKMKVASAVSDSFKPHGLYSLWNSPGQITGVGILSLLQGILPTQELNLGLLHCRQILYQLSHRESPFGKSTLILSRFFLLLFFRNDGGV